MNHLLSLINWEFVIRLLAAGFCGILIGLEREYRAKEAGYRTHFMVCLGSALMMIISKYAFWDLTSGTFNGVGNETIDTQSIISTLSIDPARIAAQVVTGIGFLGAGTIILQRQTVRGLTTAAGIWATGGIGLAIGAGLYIEAGFATILILLALEILTILFKGFSIRGLNIQFEVDKKETLNMVEQLFKEKKYIIVSYKIVKQESSTIIVESFLKLTKRGDEKEFFSLLSSIPGVTIRSME